MTKEPPYTHIRRHYCGLTGLLIVDSWLAVAQMKFHADTAANGGYSLWWLHQARQIMWAGHNRRVKQRAEQIAVFLGLAHEEVIEAQCALRESESRYQLVARQHKFEVAPRIGRHIDIAHTRPDSPCLALLAHDARHSPHELVALDRMTGAEVLHVWPCAGELENGVEKLEVLPAGPELEQETAFILAHTDVLTHLQDGRPVFAGWIDEQQAEVGLCTPSVGNNLRLLRWLVGHQPVYQGAVQKKRPGSPRHPALSFSFVVLPALGLFSAISCYDTVNLFDPPLHAHRVSSASACPQD